MGETFKGANRINGRLHAGLSALDGVRISPNEFQPFEFDGKVSYGLSKNLVIVERAKDEYDRSTRKLMRDAKVATGDTVTDENRDRILNLQSATDAANDDEVVLNGLIFFKISELYNKRKSPDGKKEIRNQIPVSVMKNLAPIIIDDFAE